MFNLTDKELKELKEILGYEFESNPKLVEFFNKLDEKRKKRNDYYAKYMAEKRKVNKNYAR